MAQCSQCKTETQLHINGVPICQQCDEAWSNKTQRNQMAGEPPKESKSFEGIRGVRWPVDSIYF